MCIPACPVSGVENMSEGRAAACRSLPRTPDCHRWLATDDPDEGSEPVHQRLGSFAAHEWEPLSVMTCHLGTRGRERCSLCLLYTSDAADDLTRVDLGGRRIIKKKK